MCLCASVCVSLCLYLYVYVCVRVTDKFFVENSQPKNYHKALSKTIYPERYLLSRVNEIAEGKHVPIDRTADGAIEGLCTDLNHKQNDNGYNNDSYSDSLLLKPPAKKRGEEFISGLFFTTI